MEQILLQIKSLIVAYKKFRIHFKLLNTEMDFQNKEKFYNNFCIIIYR